MMNNLDNLDIYNKVRNVPETAKRTIGAGRLKGFTDINPMWRIRTLTEQFGCAGFGWYYKTIERWQENADNGEKLCFVTIALYVKIDGEWSQPIEGTGGSKIAASERSGIYNDDEGYKKATTDALSIACKNLGIGADVWWNSDRTKYTTEPDEKLYIPEGQQAHHSVMKIPIGEEQVKILQTEMKLAGVTTEQVLATCNVGSLDQISAECYVKIMKKLKKTKEVKSNE